MSCKIWLKKKFLSRLSPCTFFFLWTSKSPTTNSLSSGSSKVITSFSCQTSNWSPLFFRDFKKNPFESFGFEATFHFHLQVHHLQVHLLRNFQGIDFSPLSPDCCFPFLELWPFDPFPLGQKPKPAARWATLWRCRRNIPPPAAFFGFQHKKNRRIWSENKNGEEISIFFLPIFGRKNFSAKKSKHPWIPKIIPLLQMLGSKSTGAASNPSRWVSISNSATDSNRIGRKLRISKIYNIHPRKFNMEPGDDGFQ